MAYDNAVAASAAEATARILTSTQAMDVVAKACVMTRHDLLNLFYSRQIKPGETWVDYAIALERFFDSIFSYFERTAISIFTT